MFINYIMCRGLIIIILVVKQYRVIQFPMIGDKIIYLLCD